MACLFATLTVEDFDRWQAAFDSDEGQALRRRGQMKSYQVLRDHHDPNRLVILGQFDDFDAARNFAQSDELRRASELSGVIGATEMRFLDVVADAAV